MRRPHIIPLLYTILISQAHAGTAGICPTTSANEIASLFDHWNATLQSGRPDQVVDNYAPRSILLATESDGPHLSPQDKMAYFKQFLGRRPVAHIDSRRIETDCNSAIDAGIYTFRFGDGAQVTAGYSFTYQRFGNRWLIINHRSSALPVRGVR
jgi:hypothetical protein